MIEDTGPAIKVGGKIRQIQIEISTARHYIDTFIQFVATLLEACRMLRILPPGGYHTRVHLYSEGPDTFVGKVQQTR